MEGLKSTSMLANSADDADNFHEMTRQRAYTVLSKNSRPATTELESVNEDGIVEDS